VSLKSKNCFGLFTWRLFSDEEKVCWWQNCWRKEPTQPYPHSSSSHMTCHTSCMKLFIKIKREKEEYQTQCFCSCWWKGKTSFFLSKWLKMLKMRFTAEIFHFEEAYHVFIESKKGGSLKKGLRQNALVIYAKGFKVFEYEEFLILIKMWGKAI